MQLSGMTRSGITHSGITRSTAQTRTGLMLFGISRNGLLAMAASVFALWSVIALETATLHRAAEDARASRQMLDRLRQSIPASEPAPWSSPRTIHAS